MGRPTPARGQRSHGERPKNAVLVPEMAMWNNGADIAWCLSKLGVQDRQLWSEARLKFTFGKAFKPNIVVQNLN